MREKLIIGELGLSESLVTWGIGLLFLLSLILAIVASFSGDSNGQSLAQASPTPALSPTSEADSEAGNSATFGSTSLDEPPANEALEPFFSGSRSIALLVSSVGELTGSESKWLEDIGDSLGPVEPIEYGDATFERLSQSSTVFVIGFSDEVDPSELKRLSDVGVSVHLIGPAARYAEAFEGVGQ